MSRRSDDGLTLGQEKAIVALMAEPSIARAAKACDVHERTIHRWLETPAFMSAYRRARREAFSHATP